MNFLAIDPGAKNTGLIIRCNSRLLYSATITTNTHESTTDFGSRCCHHILQLIEEYNVKAIAVEGVVCPNPHVRKNLISPQAVINLATVFGMVLGCIPSYIPVVVVRPDKNGSLDKRHYPKELNGKRPKELPGFSHGTRQHERSAWDVSAKSFLELRARCQQEQQA